MDDGQTLTMLKAWTTWPTPTPPHSASESCSDREASLEPVPATNTPSVSLAPYQPPRRDSVPPSLVPALGETPTPLLVFDEDIHASTPASGFGLLRQGVRANTVSSQDTASSSLLDSHKDPVSNASLLPEHQPQIDESTEPEKPNCYTFPHSHNATLPTIVSADYSDSSSSQFMGIRQDSKMDSLDVPSRECIDTLAPTPNLASLNTSPSPSSYSAQVPFPPSLPSICIVDMLSPEGTSDDLFLSSAVAPSASLLHPIHASRNLSVSSTSLIPSNAYNFSDSMSCISSDQEDDSDDDEVLYLDQTMRDGGSGSSSDSMMDQDEPVVDEASFAESISLSANAPGNLSMDDEFDAEYEDDGEGFIGGHCGILPSGPPQAPKPPIPKPVPTIDLDATSTDSSGSDSETSRSGSSSSGSGSSSDSETEDGRFPFLVPLLPVLNGSSPLKTKRIKLVLKPSPPLSTPTSTPQAPTPAMDPAPIAIKPRRASMARISSFAENDEDDLGPTAPRRVGDGGAFVPRKPLGRPPGRPPGTRGRPSVDGLAVPQRRR
ncbi:hypothetical protein BC830DRAFT_209411 [Chytriomyces sp. MP71]|nr:hypothetical protein BC830DRAFT_209411 [Chytriomyces sp. MP71]